MMMKILIPIDGSDCSKKTLSWSANFLEPDRSEIYLVHVIYFTPQAFVSDLEIEEGIKMLDEAKQYFERKGFTVKESKYVLGTPSDAICEFADEMNVDQIIIGSHGRQGLARFLMGSVSEGVFKCASQPVILVNNGPKSSIAISHPESFYVKQE